MKSEDVKQKLNILVAEDDELNRILLCEILEKYGCSYRAAENGKDAVDLFRKERFDVVFLDLNMPVMGGGEAARAIREMESGRSRAIIALLSASALMDERKKNFAAEADYHFMKPYYPSEIFEFLDGISEHILSSDQPGETRGRQTGAEMRKVFEKVDCDVEFFETLLKKFKKSSAELMNKIWESILKDDGAAIKECAHTLKGELLIFNATESVGIASQLEAAGASGNLDDVNKTAEDLEAQIGRLLESYAEFLDQEKKHD